MLVGEAMVRSRLGRQMVEEFGRDSGTVGREGVGGIPFMQEKFCGRLGFDYHLAEARLVPMEEIWQEFGGGPS